MKIRFVWLVVLSVSALIVGGCRIKSVESYESANTPNDTASGKTIDPYTFGGSAAASGGKNAQTSYATSTPGSGYTAAAPLAQAAAPAKKK